MTDFSAETARRIFREELAASRADLKREIEAALETFGTRLGLDVGRPMEQQADLAHLRRLRELREHGVTRAVVVLISLGLTGLAGTVWSFFSGALHFGAK